MSILRCKKSIVATRALIGLLGCLPLFLSGLSREEALFFDAVNKKDYGAVTFFIEEGLVEPFCKNENGKSAYAIAAENKDTILSYLLRRAKRRRETKTVTKPAPEKHNNQLLISLASLTSGTVIIYYFIYSLRRVEQKLEGVFEQIEDLAVQNKKIMDYIAPIKQTTTTLIVNRACDIVGAFGGPARVGAEVARAAWEGTGENIEAAGQQVVEKGKALADQVGMSVVRKTKQAVFLGGITKNPLLALAVFIAS